MGPTLSPTLVLRAAVPWGLGFLGTFGAWEPEPRSQGSGSHGGLLLPDDWPPSPQLPLPWNWLLLTLPSSQRALISHIDLNFKIARAINRTLLSILKKATLLFVPPRLQLLPLGAVEQVHKLRSLGVPKTPSLYLLPPSKKNELWVCLSAPERHPNFRGCPPKCG